MDFNGAINVVKDGLTKTGISVNGDYDGLIVKKLESSNTLDANRTTKQTHIAITGDQMDMFPYVKSEGYFTDDYDMQNGDMKKYFVAQIPILIYKANVNYMDESSDIIFESDSKKVYASIVRSRRNGAADQIQMSMTYIDSPDFIAFRKIIHSGDYMIMLKYRGKLEYEMYAIKSSDLDEDSNLKDLNGKFYYSKSTTAIHIDEIKDKDNSDMDYKEQKERFKAWLTEQRKANGEPYSVNTIAAYLSGMERAYRQFDDYNEYESPFQIQDSSSADEYTEYLFNAEGFEEFNIKAGNRACEFGWLKYKEFLGIEDEEFIQPVYNTDINIDTPRNRIYFGAPGTGKSYTINEDRKKLLGEDNETDYERVTFHPDYSYANFVGTYKPVPKGNGITYEYVPGPFMRVYVQAIKNGRTDNVKPYLLIIEEINRANVAAVFGDIFQLLDRDESEVSEYPIQVSEDAKAYLSRELGGKPTDYSSIRIPNNMFIWATMNSADQGVFPMDTAFKRRWDFNYIGINNNEDKIADKTVTLEVESTGENILQVFKWNDLRKAINDMLGALKVNEDKMLGTFFISKKALGDDSSIDAEKFKEVFKSKVIMYLFEDAARQRRDEIFEGCKVENKALKYSEICDSFDKHGVEIFNKQILDGIKSLKGVPKEGE